MRLRFCGMAVAGALLLSPASARAGQVVWVDSLNLDNVAQDFGGAHARTSVDGNPIKIGGEPFEHGFGTHATSAFVIPLDGKAQRFDAAVGVDDETKGRGSVVFRVLVDGKAAAKSAVLHGGDRAQRLSVPLKGARTLTLLVDLGEHVLDFAHGDWANASITLINGATALPPIQTRPRTINAEPRLRVTSPSETPAIHGPRIVGATPGRPFLFRISATGARPFTYNANGLPGGLTLDPSTGIIRGALKKAGRTQVGLVVQGPKGIARRQLTIVGGDNKLAMTPPLGWNSWNVWGTQVNAERVKAAADELLATGLADHGFQYVNIDDAWEAGRDAAGVIQTNSKFPDMKGLGNYIHSKGLRFGIYSSPGPATCGGYTGSYQHEAQDARSYADWGVDYLKYDWCSYSGVAGGRDLPALQKPYAAMRTALDGVDRDILYSLCQYGDGDVWTWGASKAIRGNCWRTTGDIQDNWGSMHSIYENQAGHEAYAGPGHWNDPDMLMVGTVGFGNPHPTHLAKNEQILHVSMWCLLSAPILIGCDLTKLDPFTLALLSNDEALDIDQDPLARPARLVRSDAGIGEVWARPLFDGSQAVGLANPNPWASRITVHWSELGLKGAHPVRDLWLHTDTGKHSDEYSVDVPAHGCVLLKVSR